MTAQKLEQSNFLPNLEPDSLVLVTETLSTPAYALLDHFLKEAFEHSQCDIYFYTFRTAHNIGTLKQRSSDQVHIINYARIPVDNPPESWTAQLGTLFTFSKGAVVFIEGLDVLVRVGSSKFGCLEVVTLLETIQQKARTIVIAMAGDDVLSNDPQHDMLLDMLVHEATIVVGVRPLNTGRAPDVTGKLRAVNGGMTQQSFNHESLYRVKDGCLWLVH